MKTSISENLRRGRSKLNASEEQVSVLFKPEFPPL